MSSMSNDTFESRTIARVVAASPEPIDAGDVRKVFAAIRALSRDVRECPFPNSFLVGATADGKTIVARGLEAAFTRDQALNLVTWMTLVAGFTYDEVEAARLEALRNE